MARAPMPGPLAHQGTMSPSSIHSTFCILPANLQSVGTLHLPAGIRTMNTAMDSHKFHLGAGGNDNVIAVLAPNASGGLRQDVVALLKDAAVLYNLVLLCGVATSSPDDKVAACIIGIQSDGRPAADVLTADMVENIAYRVLSLFVPHVGASKILVQLTKSKAQPFNHQPFAYPDLETASLFPGASVSVEDRSGTFSFAVNVEPRESAGNWCHCIGALSGHVAADFVSGPSAFTRQLVLSPSAPPGQATDRTYLGRAQAIGHTVMSTNFDSTAVYKDERIRQDIALVEIDGDQPPYKPVSQTLINQSEFMSKHFKPGAHKPNDTVTLGAASGVTTGTRLRPKATVVLRLGANKQGTETTECVMVPTGYAAPTYGDSGALIYRATEVRDNIASQPDKGDKDKVTVHLTKEFPAVDVSKLCFFTELDAILSEVFTPYLDQKYGRDRYELNWTSSATTSGGAGSGADVDKLTQALGSMGM
ncbi:hypothetical protein PG994_002657 [Apiospora phragmitis]|uniref:Uncharacterized protein n=1 Tax=Apiospora phragmitis TaxID=2905665 RepID=A0ABR1W5R5_9PEZI